MQHRQQLLNQQAAKATRILKAEEALAQLRTELAELDVQITEATRLFDLAESELRYSQKAADPADIDLADQDDALGTVVLQERGEEVGEAHALHRVAADADPVAGADALARQAIADLVGQGAAFRHQGERARVQRHVGQEAQFHFAGNREPGGGRADPGGACRADDAAGGHDEGVYEGETAQIVAEIKDLLDSRIRPAVAQDGGDILFNRFDVATGVVYLNMRGACSGCPSSSATLKAGVETMLKHDVPEVTGVEQTL